MEMPSGHQKYIRLLDDDTEPKALWELLTKYWELYIPNLVISIDPNKKEDVDDKVLEQLVAVAEKTKAWILTDGLDHGITERIALAVQRYVRQLKDKDPYDPFYIPLIGFASWTNMDKKKQQLLSGKHEEKDALYENVDTKDTQGQIQLNPYHSVYILTDERQTVTADDQNISNRETLQQMLLNYINTEKQGFFCDPTTVDKWPTDVNIPTIAVLIEESGKVEITLKGSESATEKCTVRFDPTDTRNRTDLTDVVIEALVAEKKKRPIEGFCLALSFDRPDIAKENVMVGYRKELNSWAENRGYLLQIALRKGRDHFVKLLLELDGGGKVKKFEDFVTLQMLRTLHMHIICKGDINCKLVQRLTKPIEGCGYILNDKQLLAQMGRVIHILMGSQYKLLYQEETFEDPTKGEIGIGNEDAVWCMLVWAILADECGCAQAFIAHTSCKLGAALVAFRMLKELSKIALLSGELEHSGKLLKSSQDFEAIAYDIIDRLYSEDRDRGYLYLVTKMPVEWARYMTPLSVAIEAEAQRFMSHACVQTLLDRIWYHYMEQTLNFFWLIPPITWLSFLWIKFDPRYLQYGSYLKELQNGIAYAEPMDQQVQTGGKGNQGGPSRNEPTTTTAATAYNNRTTPTAATANNNKTTPTAALAAAQQNQSKAEVQTRKISFLEFRLWSLRMFLTSPAHKFSSHLVSYLIFLGAFTHFLLSVLEPIANLTDVSGWEWFIMIYVASLALEEVVQLFSRRISGPLYEMKDPVTSNWSAIWSPWERFCFFTRSYKLSHWLSDSWNIVDVIMLMTYIIAVIFRFSLGVLQFSLVRIMFVASMIIFFIRFLRFGCLSYFIGPRLVTIGKMFSDLIKFMLILAVFIVSFGIAFQALLEPNQPPGVSAVISILWRPYWQLYETLYLDDIMDSEGYNIQVARNCTYHLNRPGEPFCDQWAMPSLIAVYKVVTIIILLNLLIAIFSHTFSITAERSLMIWRHQLGTLVHEYYYQVWLPPPLNMICHGINFFIWLASFPRNKVITEVEKNLKGKGKHNNHFFQHSQGIVKFKEERKWLRLREKTMEEKVDDIVKANKEMEKNITWLMKNINNPKGVLMNVGHFCDCEHKQDRGERKMKTIDAQSSVDVLNVCIHVSNGIGSPPGGSQSAERNGTVSKKAKGKIPTDTKTKRKSTTEPFSSQTLNKDSMNRGTRSEISTAEPSSDKEKQKNFGLYDKVDETMQKIEYGSRR